MNLGAMIVELLLKKGQYKADLDAAVTDTKAATSKIQANAQGLAGATQEALSGQMDMASGAARALGVLGPMGAAAAVVAVSVAVAYQQAAQETRAYEKALVMTGNAAGVSVGQLMDMARAIDEVVGTQSDAAAALAAMAASGKVAGGDLQKFAMVAVEMERTVGQSVGDTVKLFEQLGAEPVKASLKLNESLNYLTTATYEQIKAAEEMGDKELAASIAQNAAADALQQRTQQLEQNLGTMQKAWRGLGDAAKWAWDRMLNVGREQTAEEQLDKVNKQIEATQADIARWASGSNLPGIGLIVRATTAALQENLTALQAQKASLGGVAHAATEAAKAEADKNAAQKAGVAAADAVAKANERAMSNQDKLNKALDDYRQNIEKVRAANPDSALLDPKLIAETEAGIRKQYATKVSGSKAYQQEAEKEAKVLAQLAGLAANFSEEWELLNKMYAKGKLNLQQLTEAQAALLAKQPAVKANAEAEAKAWEKVEKANMAATKAHESHIATLDKGLEKLQDQVRAQEEHNARIGLGKQAIAELDAAKLEELATVQEGLAVKALDKNLDEAQYALYKAQAAELRKLAALKREGGARQEAVDAAQAVEKENNRMLESLDKTAHDVWVSVGDEGVDAFKRAGKTLKAAVLDGLYQMFARKWILNVGTSITGGSTGAAGGGVGGIGNLISSGLGQLGNLIPGFSAFGGAMGSGFMAAINGGMGVALEGGMAMLGSASGFSSALAGIGQIAGALGPIALGLGAVYAVWKSMDDSGTPHGGSMAEYSAADGLSTSQKHGAFGMGFGGVDANENIKTFVSGLSASMVTMLDSVSKAFGGTGGYSVATGFADDSSKDGAWGGLLIKKLGEEVLNWDDTRSSKWAPREFADGEAGQKEYLAAAAKDLLGVFKDMDLAGWADEVLDALGDAPALEDLATAIDQINATKAALDVMGKNLVGFAGYSDEATSKLIKASGGISNLASNAATFYDAYYSESEKQANATRDVTDALAKVNIALPGSREEYRKLVEQYTAMGPAGADTLAVLLGMSGAFAAITPAGEAAAATVEELMKKLRDPTRSAEDIARNTIGLEDKLFQTENKGNTAALRERELQGLSENEKAIQRRIWALEDEATAAEKAAAAEAARVSEREGLERQLMELNGDTAGIRALERAQLDETNRALYDSLKAREDELARLNERQGIERDILSLQGDTAALRALELEGLDAANRARKEYYYSLVDEAAEMQKAAQVASERAGIERDILSLQGDTAALRALELEGLDPANRALKEHYYALLDEKNAAEAAAAAVRAAANEHASLQERLWQIEGNTGALREAALKKLLDDESRDLQRRIWAAEDEADARQKAAAAAQAAASAAAQWAQDQAAAAKAVRDAWQDVSDSLVDEMKRIKGEMVGGGSQGVAAAEAQFAIATAAARAGDQEAAKSLPALSQALLALKEANAGSLVELRRAQAAQIASLAATNAILAQKFGFTVPSYAVGTAYVPFDQLAMVHKGEAIVPEALNTGFWGGTGSNADVLTELRRLGAVLQSILVPVQSGALHAKATVDLLTRVTEKGNAMRTKVVTT